MGGGDGGVPRLGFTSHTLGVVEEVDGGAVWQHAGRAAWPGTPRESSAPAPSLGGRGGQRERRIPRCCPSMQRWVRAQVKAAGWGMPTGALCLLNSFCFFLSNAGIPESHLLNNTQMMQMLGFFLARCLLHT